MPEKTVTARYRRIASSVFVLVQRTSLWITDGHLLLVKTSGYTEEYTRIYLKDLKGVSSARTRGWMLGNTMLGAITLLIFLGIMNSDNLFSFGAFFMGAFLLPFLVAFIVNLALGPTCRTEFLTPLGPLRIPALSRTRKLEKLLQELRPAIATVQGSMPRSRLLSDYEDIRTGVKPAAEAP